MRQCGGQRDSLDAHFTFCFETGPLVYLFIVYVCSCVHTHAHTHTCECTVTHMWRSKDELSDIVGGPCGFWCWNSGLQAWQQVSHLAGPR